MKFKRVLEKDVCNGILQETVLTYPLRISSENWGANGAGGSRERSGSNF